MKTSKGVAAREDVEAGPGEHPCLRLQQAAVTVGQKMSIAAGSVRGLHEWTAVCKVKQIPEASAMMWKTPARTYISTC